MRTLLEIYLGINIFIAGIDFENRQSSDSWIVISLGLLISLLFGALIYVICLIIDGLKGLYSYFQLGFFYRYFFTKKYYNVLTEDLETYNDWAEYWHKNTFQNRLRRYTVKLVNRRNNYKPNLK